MGPAVDLQDVVVEVLDAEAQARDANLPDGLELVVRQRARLAFERHLLRLVPAQDRLHPVGQVLELRLGQVGGRAAAEIDELRLAPADERLLPVKLQLAKRQLQIPLDGRGVLVGIDAEVAEVAALPAERDVQVEAQLGARRRRPAQGGGHLGHPLRLPERERGVIRDEVVPYRRFLLRRYGRRPRFCNC